MNQQAVDRAAIGVLVAGVAIGTVTHTLHLVNVGWIVFDDAPIWMNVYWTALTALDPLAAVLLIYCRQIGLALGAAIILSDVGINGYALYGLGLSFGFLSIQLQTCSADFCSAQPGSCGGRHRNQFRYWSDPGRGPRDGFCAWHARRYCRVAHGP